MKQKYFNQVVESLKKAGINYNGEKFIYIDDLIKVEKFLLSFSGYHNVLGFDLFNGVCSGNSNICFSSNNIISFKAQDCGTDKFTFRVKSMFVLINEKNDNVCPTLIFESDNISASCFEMSDNIRYDDHDGGYRYLKRLHIIDEDGGKRIVADNDEVDELLDLRYNSQEDIPNFYSEDIFLDRKIFACLNIQGEYDMIHPFSFQQFLFDYNNKPIQSIKAFLDAILK